MKEIKTCLGEALSQMPTAQLDEKLQQELQKETPNEEVVLGIIRVLQDREADHSVEITEAVSDAWDTYQKRTTPSKKNPRKHIWIISVAAIAAMLCIVILAIPQTAGANSVRDALFRWSASLFEFFSPEQDAANPPVEYVFQTDHPGLQQLYDKATELGVSEPVVPMWMPEGFVLSELRELPTPSGTRLHVKFESDGKAILLTYRISMDIHPRVEKEETGVELLEIGEVDHFITDNDTNLSVIWTVDGVECLLNTNIPKDNLYRIIKSIYRSELT